MSEQENYMVFHCLNCSKTKPSSKTKPNCAIVYFPVANPVDIGQLDCPICRQSGYGNWVFSAITTNYRNYGLGEYIYSAMDLWKSSCNRRKEKK